MAAHDAGVQVECPGCGQIVLQKAMIPIVGEGGQGVTYLCPACARALIVPPTVPAGDGGGDSGDTADTADTAASDC